MIISLLEFGYLGSFNKIMNNNLTLFENNIIEIKKFLNIKNDDIIDIYILTEKKDNFDISIKTLKKILVKQKVKLQLLNYWQELEEYHKEDIESYEKYKNIFNIEEYGYDSNNINHNPWGYDNKKNFNPGNLWFRRFVNFDLFNNYIKKNNLNYDYICLTRLFSTKIINLESIENINKDYLYFSLDTLFISSFDNIKKLLKFGKKSLFFNNKNYITNKPIILDDEDFIKYSNSLDNIIGNHVFCSEIQILYYIYKNFKNYINLRFPYPNYIYNEKIHELAYTNNYNEEYLEDICFKVENSNLFIVISR
jgi:hypothetical protein